MDRPILFVSHQKRQCGVQQFGLKISDALRSSRRFDFRYVECNSPTTFTAAMEAESPAAVIYNHHPATMPWLSREVVRPYKRVPHIGVMHETTQSFADEADDSLFDYHIAPDPTLLLRNPIVFKTGRLVPRYRKPLAESHPPVIGTFGFGTKGKGFDRLILKVQEDFDLATIKLHIPFSAFFDAEGTRAREIGEDCRKLVTKPGIQLELNHEFLSEADLLAFLASNSLNAFLYEDQTGRGISSVIDFALAVGRPVAVSKSSMFRHIYRTRPSITVEDSTLSDILARGFAPIAPYAEEWTAENLVWDYERIVESVLSRSTKESTVAWIRNLPTSRPQIPTQATVKQQVSRTSRRLLRRGTSALRSTRGWLMRSPLKAVVGPLEKGGPLLKTRLAALERYLVGASIGRPISVEVADAQTAPDVGAYSPNDGPPSGGFNRILDAGTQRDYMQAMEYLQAFARRNSSISERAPNIEQAFVVDTISRLVRRSPQPHLLDVGGHEVLSAALAASGYGVDQINPTVNYDLDTYMTKPTRKRAYFDAVFAVSTIGCASDDAVFLKSLQDLMAPGGIAVVTCGLNGHAKRGWLDRASPERVYSSTDLQDRLLPLMDRCELVDSPNWAYKNGKSSPKSPGPILASLVVRKVSG